MLPREVTPLHSTSDVQESDVHLVHQLRVARSRVTPVNRLTIPRLDLNAAFLLSNVYKKFQVSLRNYPAILFSDSQVVLSGGYELLLFPCKPI